MQAGSWKWALSLALKTWQKRTLLLSRRKRNYQAGTSVAHFQRQDWGAGNSDNDNKGRSQKKGLKSRAREVNSVKVEATGKVPVWLESKQKRGAVEYLSFFLIQTTVWIWRINSVTNGSIKGWRLIFSKNYGVRRTMKHLYKIIYIQETHF